MKQGPRPGNLLCGALLLGVVWLPPPDAARAASEPDPPPSILVAPRTAEDLGLRPGDLVELSRDGAFRAPRRFRVAGVYRPVTDPSEVSLGLRRIQMHLPDLESLTGERDRATSIALRLAPGADADSVARELTGLGLGVVAYPAETLARSTGQTYAVVTRFHVAIALVTLAAGAVFLLAIMVLAVEERRRELGTLRLIGIRARSITRGVVLAALTVALAGSAVGIGLAYVLAAGVNRFYQAKYRTDLVFAHVSSTDVALAVALGLVLGLLAALGALAKLVRADVLRLVGR